MKRLTLALAAVAFLAAPAMAQADGLYVSPAKQQVMAEEGYTLETHTEVAPPILYKSCPGPKKAKDVGQRLRNSNGATLWRHWFQITQCYGPNGDHKWHRIDNVRYATPSAFWDRAHGPVNQWKRGTAWSEMWIVERVPGVGTQYNNRVWKSGLYINPHFSNGGIWFSKGRQLQ